MAYKKERIERILEKEISTIIFNEVKDQRLKFVTITKVIVTNDLSLATVFFTVFGDEEQIDATITTLLEAKGYIKAVLSKRLEIRKVPELSFKYDNSFVEGNKIEQILKNINRD